MDTSTIRLDPDTPGQDKAAALSAKSSFQHTLTDHSDHTTHALPVPNESTMIPEPKNPPAPIERLQDDWENDPENPLNWAPRKKWISMAIVSLYTFLPPLASSMMAPGLPDVAKTFGIANPTIVALTLTSFLISFGLGPLFLAPLSEMYGRTWVLHIANIFSIGFSLGCAFSPTTGALIGFRILAGLSGSAPIAIGTGTVSDLFSERDRASAMAIYTLGPLVGPIIGPIAGGFITQSLGIKWVFIIIAICSAVASILGIALLQETYAPVLLERKLAAALLAASSSPSTSTPSSSADLEKGESGTSSLEKVATQVVPVDSLQKKEKLVKVLWDNLSRPATLLCRSFICFVLSLYMSFLYGIYYLMFSTFAALFHSTYGFSAGVGGLVYSGLGVGFMTSTLFGAKWADRIYKNLADKNGGKGKPEMRVPALIFGSFFIPVGLLWYGWSAQAKLHWIMPIIGTSIFGFGMMACFLPISLYLVDAFTYAASATAAASVFRSLLGFAFPLFGTQMFDTLGLGGGNSLLAGFAVILGIPFPIWIWFKGEELRAQSKYTRRP